jgi:hypothetical protein
MKIPEFKSSKEFFGEINLFCLVATVANSTVPGLATRHISKYGEDLQFDVFVRGKKADEISDWQESILQRLFENEELPEAIEQGMKEFETSDEWAGYERDEENYGDIKRYGILPHLTLVAIVIDEIRHEVILSLNTEWDGNLAEHGIVISLHKERWKFNYLDYLSEYCMAIEAEQKERRLADVVFPGVAKTKSESAAELIYGTWEFDEKEARILLKKLGVPESQVEGDISSFKHHRFDISQTRLRMRTSRWNKYDLEFLGCEKRGDKVTIKFRDPGAKKIESRDFYFQNDLLKDSEGLVLRRKKSMWSWFRK